VSQAGKISGLLAGSLALLTLLLSGLLYFVSRPKHLASAVREAVIYEKKDGTCYADDIAVHRVDSIRWCKGTTSGADYTITFKEQAPVLGSPASTTSALPLSVDSHAAYGDYPYKINRDGERNYCADPVVHVVPDTQSGYGQKCP
jgi:hypothetical protein